MDAHSRFLTLGTVAAVLCLFLISGCLSPETMARLSGKPTQKKVSPQEKPEETEKPSITDIKVEVKKPETVAEKKPVTPDLQKDKPKEVTKPLTPEEAAWAEIQADIKALPKLRYSASDIARNKWNRKRLPIAVKTEAFLKKYPKTTHLKVGHYLLLSIAKGNFQHEKTLTTANTLLKMKLEDRAIPSLLETKVKALKPLKRMKEARQVVEQIRSMKDTNRFASSKLFVAELFLNELAIGDKVHEFSGIDLNGNKVSSKDFKGKVVIIHFWYMLSETGVKQIDQIRKMLKKYGDKGVVAVGISSERSIAAYGAFNFYKNRRKDLKYPRTEDDVKAFCKEKGVAWPQIYDDAKPKISYQFGLGRKGFPECIVINKKGKVVGLRKDTYGDKLKAVVKKAMK